MSKDVSWLCIEICAFDFANPGLEIEPIGRSLAKQNSPFQLFNFLL